MTEYDNLKQELKSLKTRTLNSYTMFLTRKHIIVVVLV